jgi:hypothetical protein
LRYVAPRCATLHHVVLRCTTLCYAAPRCATLHHVVLRCTTLCYAALRCATLHHVVLRCTTLCYVAPRCATLHHVVLRCIALRYAASLCATLHHAVTDLRIHLASSTRSDCTCDRSSRICHVPASTARGRQHGARRRQPMATRGIGARKATAQRDRWHATHKMSSSQAAKPAWRSQAARCATGALSRIWATGPSDMRRGTSAAPRGASSAQCDSQTGARHGRPHRRDTRSKPTTDPSVRPATPCATAQPPPGD